MMKKNLIFICILCMMPIYAMDQSWQLTIYQRYACLSGNCVCKNTPCKYAEEIRKRNEEEQQRCLEQSKKIRPPNGSPRN